MATERTAILPHWVYDLITAIETYEDEHGAGTPCFDGVLHKVPDVERDRAAAITAYTAGRPRPADPREDPPELILRLGAALEDARKAGGGFVFGHFVLDGWQVAHQVTDEYAAKPADRHVWVVRRVEKDEA